MHHASRTQHVAQWIDAMLLRAAKVQTFASGWALTNATGLKVQIVEDPLSSVARGTSIYLENLEIWKDTMDRSEYGRLQYATSRG